MNMTKAIKEDLLPKLRERSARRQREGKTRMLDELCEDYGCERKYASKLLRDAVPPPGSPAANGWPRPCRCWLWAVMVRTVHCIGRNE